MLAWSIFQILTGGLMIFIAVTLFPIAAVLMLVLFLYSLTPYLVVLQDISFGEALGKAPRLLRRYFIKLLPLSLLALIGTFSVSLLQSLPAPWGYAVPLVAYAFVGTWLIGELMRQLAGKLRIYDEPAPNLPVGEFQAPRWIHALMILLVPVLVAAGILAASGRHLSVLDIGRKDKLMDGVAYRSNFSDAYYASQWNYTAYEWQTNGYSLTISLPDLSGEQKPEVLRGIADITWQVTEDIRSVKGHSTLMERKPVTRKSRIMYRLVRQTATNGGFYYSSKGGAASILPNGERPHEPLSVGMMISGDGSQLYVLQFPSRFDSSQVFRVSDDGRYFIPKTNEINPTDFHAYWFTAEQNTDNLFGLLAAKNKTNNLGILNQSAIVLASAMQEGDGRMVVNLLETLRKAGVSVTSPDWDERTWTDHLHSRYNGVTLQQTLELLTKAGVQGTYQAKELQDLSDDKTGVYRLEVSFPDGKLPITYRISKADGKLLSMSLG
ncbi:hypothetical protein MJA45_13930 [Paenibacillus aurantius]|uniref:Uncharacterized protein n=1 Tax=Paenibacillus aurantius TaxID=2918900 RepID=A0AA96RI49_9BACL|nr:hypothetical protein [Paenibacillus aurantius]WNQ14068.1 hypothetical protein MJA45_13930 [Paenibacillus aurantius]